MPCFSAVIISEIKPIPTMEGEESMFAKAGNRFPGDFGTLLGTWAISPMVALLIELTIIRDTFPKTADGLLKKSSKGTKETLERFLLMVFFIKPLIFLKNMG